MMIINFGYDTPITLFYEEVGVSQKSTSAYPCTSVQLNVCACVPCDVCMHVRMYVCMYACTYVCMHVCVCVCGEHMCVCI